MRSPYSIRPEYTLILLTAFAAHTLFLSNSGIYFDGWLLKGLLLSDKGLMFDFFSRAGLPLNYYVYIFADTLAPFPMGFKWLGFMSHVTSSVITFKILNNSKFAALRLIDLPTALLFAVNPFSISAIEPTHLFYSLTFTALLASLAILNSQSVLTKSKIVFVSALLLFAFNTASLLLIFLGWLTFLFYEHFIFFERRMTKKYILQFIYLFCLPFLYWFAKSLFASPYVEQQDYNTLVFDLPMIVMLFLKVPEMFIKLITWEAKLAAENAIATIVLICIFFISIKGRMFHRLDSYNNSKKLNNEILSCIVLFSIIFIATSLPYNLVQKGFALGLNQDRQNFLIVGPAITIAVLLLTSVFRNKRNLFVVCLSIGLAISAVTTVNRHLDYQIRAIKDEGIDLHLGRIIHLLNPDVIHFNDRIMMNSSGEDLNWYIDHHLAGRFASVDRKFKRIGIPVKNAPRTPINSVEVELFLEKFKIKQYIGSYNLNRQIYVEITGNVDYSNRLALLYAYVSHQLFKDQSEFDTFLGNLVNVKVKKI